MYSYTQPYLWHGYKVFDIIKAERFLFFEWWSVADTQFWTSESKSKDVVLYFNISSK